MYLGNRVASGLKRPAARYGHVLVFWTHPCGEAPRSHLSVARAVANGDLPGAERPARAAVPVAIALAAALHLLGEFVDPVEPARRVHPADVAVEPLIDEELTPG